jgi:hypothetical protein
VHAGGESVDLVGREVGDTHAERELAELDLAPAAVDEVGAAGDQPAIVAGFQSQSG